MDSEEKLLQRRLYYNKNKDIINRRNLLYYYRNKEKWKDYHTKYYNNKKVLTEYMYAKHKIDEIKDLIQFNNKIDEEIDRVKKNITKKEAYLKNLRKKANINSKITIDPSAKLIIYWND